MRASTWIPLIIIALIVAVAYSQTVVIVDETQQVVITEFGKPIKVIEDPGLTFKLPIIQEAHYFENRLLEYDAEPTEVITADKKTMVLDNYAQFRIVDPLLFLQTVATEGGAQSRLDDLIYSEIRVEVGRFVLHEIVATHRRQIMAEVTQRCDELAREFGMEVVDVRIKRADLPPENEQAVFDRMEAERGREAKKYRSEGQEEAAKIRADADKESQILLAEAYKAAEEIRGSGDAEAIRIYADAFNKDPEFYSFIRSLDAYRVSLQGEKVLILSPEQSSFLQYFLSPTGGQ